MTEKRGTMNLVNAEGGNRFQRNIAEKVVGEMIDYLMPRLRTLDISVIIKKMPKNEDAIGWCNMLDTNREFEIEVSKDLSLRDFVTTICHEMVHVKQYARNEMTDTGMRWKSKRVPEKTKYYDLPWEKEAYRMQDKLAEHVWKMDIL